MFKATQVQLSIAKTSSIYKIDALDKGSLVTTIYYIPEQRRLDVWELGSQLPIIQFVGKKIVGTSYSSIFQRVGVESLFMRLVSNV